MICVRPPAEVVLWGSFPPLADYLELLHGAGIRPSCLVDPGSAGGEVHGVPAISPEQYRFATKVRESPPVVVLNRCSFSSEPSAPTSDGEKHFGRAAACGTATGDVDGGFAGDDADDPLWSTLGDFARQGLARVRLLDPLFVADHVDATFSGRVLAGGFPGSGNGVVQAVIEHLVAQEPESLAPREHLVAFLAGQRHERLARRLHALLGAGERQVSGLAHHRHGALHFLEITPDERQWVVYNLPGRSHLFSRLHKTHEPLTAGLVAGFRRMGYEVVVAVRHPLDTLVSLAAKLTRPPVHALNRSDWFDQMAQALARYLVDVLHSERQVHLVRYEDLLADPEASITGLAQRLGVACAPAEAADIWQAVGLKPLHFSPGHLWQPGSGKWRRYLDERHLAIARRRGLPELARALGYADATDDELIARTETPAEPLDALMQQQAALTDHTFSSLYDELPSLRHPSVRFAQHASGPSWVSSCAEAAGVLGRELTSPRMARYLASLPG